MPAYEYIDQNDTLKSCLNQYLSIIVDLHNEGFTDPVGLAKAEVFLARYSCFNHSIAITSNLIKRLYEQMSEFSKREQNSIDVCARAIWSYYKEDLIGLYGNAMHHHRFDNIINQYITFKKDIENVSPEVAKEIDNLINMDDKEFEESLLDEDDSSDTSQSNQEYMPDYDIPDEKLYDT